MLDLENKNILQYIAATASGEGLDKALHSNLNWWQWVSPTTETRQLLIQMAEQKPTNC